MQRRVPLLKALLVKLRLEKFTENFKTLGVESKADLAYLEVGGKKRTGRLGELF